MKKNNNRPNQNNFSFGNIDMSSMFANQNQNNNDNSIESQINKYSSMSEERLMQEMFNLVNQGKQNGTLDNQKLDEFFNSASCMLTNEQKTKLRSLIDIAKNT